MTISSIEAPSVVLVDDDNMFARQIIAILEDNEIEVFRARDAESALKLCRRKKPDFVICDYPLPDMDYQQWVAKLRLLNIHRILTISSVQVTARVVNELHDVLGVPKIMQRPVRPEALMESLRLLAAVTAAPNQDWKQSDERSSDDVDTEHDSAFSRRDAADMARWISSLTVMARTARQHPEKQEYMIEVLAQAERITKTIESRNIERLRESIRTINATLAQICEKGSQPHLQEWDVLESTFLWLEDSSKSRPVGFMDSVAKSSIEIEASAGSSETNHGATVSEGLRESEWSTNFTGKEIEASAGSGETSQGAAVSAGFRGSESSMDFTGKQIEASASSSETGQGAAVSAGLRESESGAGFTNQTFAGLVETARAPNTVLRSSGSATSTATLKCLLVSSRTDLSATVSDALAEESLELSFASDSIMALQAVENGDFALVIVVLPESASQSKLDLIVFTDQAKKLNNGENRPSYIFIADDSTLHARVLACSQSNCRMVPSSSIRSQQFLELIAEATSLASSPHVLIVHESISQSESLFKCLASKCRSVKSTTAAIEVPELIESYSPDIVYIGSQITTDITPFDLCRVIRRTSISQSCIIAFEIEKLESKYIDAAYQAGADLIAVAEESVETRSNRVLSVYRRMNMGGRKIVSAKQKTITDSHRTVLAERFSQAARDQLRLTLVLIAGCEDVPNETTMSQLVRRSMQERSIVDNGLDLFRLNADSYLLVIWDLERTSSSGLIETLHRVLSDIANVGSLKKVQIRSCSYPDDGVTLNQLLAVIRLGS